MNEKIDKRMIRDLILEQVEELFQSGEEDVEEEEKLSQDSADDQIDAFIIKFERDSILEEEDVISESLQELTLEAFLLEQEEPADAAPPPPDEEGAPAEEAEADADVEVEEPVAPSLPPLDVEAFAKRVARLAMNNDVLLDIQSIIINRALNFLLDNYDQAHYDAMAEVLDTQFDMGVGPEAKAPEAPYAVGAFQGGTGQMGGGGV
jgi:hypothetical protein